MDFSLSESEEAIFSLCDRIGMEQFRPTALDRRLDPSPPFDHLKILAEAGVLGLCAPEGVGGSARSVLEGTIASERLSYACPVTATYAMSAMAGPASFISEWGTQDQKDRFVHPVIQGTKVCSISLTEPEAGSALTDLRTTATISGETCLLNGQKTFCSMATYADYIVTFVRFGPGVAGIGAVIVEPGVPGFTMGPTRYHAAGTPWSDLYFDSAEIPIANVLFDGNAIRNLMGTYSLERLGYAAHMLGIAQFAFEMAVSYAESREQFGRPICEFQFVQGHLADAYLALEQARLLTFKAAASVNDKRVPGRLMSSAAKVAATEAATFVTDKAMQVFGGIGMCQETGIEWLHRLARQGTIAGGTSDIHRSMIAGELVGRRFDHRPGAVAASR